MADLDQTFNGPAKGKDKQVGIILFAFPYGATDRQSNYISNGADRKDIVAFLKETAARSKDRMHERGGQA